MLDDRVDRCCYAAAARRDGAASGRHGAAWATQLARIDAGENVELLEPLPEPLGLRALCALRLPSTGHCAAESVCRSHTEPMYSAYSSAALRSASTLAAFSSHVSLPLLLPLPLPPMHAMGRGAVARWVSRSGWCEQRARLNWQPSCVRTAQHNGSVKTRRAKASNSAGAQKLAHKGPEPK